HGILDLVAVVDLAIHLKVIQFVSRESIRVQSGCWPEERHLKSNTIVDKPVAQDVKAAAKVQFLKQPLQHAAFNVLTVDRRDLLPLFWLRCLQKRDDVRLKHAEITAVAVGVA